MNGAYLIWYAPFYILLNRIWAFLWKFRTFVKK